jgi:hypothetical protein
MGMRDQKEEPLREMKDKQLESQAPHEIWLYEIILGSPWKEDVFHRACVKGECKRPSNLEIFKRVRQRVLTILGQKRVSDQ